MCLIENFNGVECITAEGPAHDTKNMRVDFSCLHYLLRHGGGIIGGCARVGDQEEQLFIAVQGVVVLGLCDICSLKHIMSSADRAAVGRVWFSISHGYAD